MIVSPKPPGYVGGVERWCELLAAALEERGIDTQIIWPKTRTARWVFRIGMRPLALSRTLGQDPRLGEADVVITNGIFGAGFPRTAPRIHVFHGTIVEMTRAYAPWLTRRERVRRTWGNGTAERLAARGATVVSVSRSTDAELRRHYRVRPARTIANGIDLDVFRPRSQIEARAELGLHPEQPVALFSGRLHFSKGGEIAAPACARAGFRLMVAGYGDAPGALNLGRLSPERLALAYAAADCVLLPSLYEACSFVALEALACQVPLLATRVGNIPELVAQLPGYSRLCIEHSEDDLVAKLQMVREEDLSGLTRSAAELVRQQFSLRQFASRWSELVLDVCSRRPGGGFSSSSL